MPHPDLTRDEIADIFGGETSAVQAHPDEIEVSLALQSVRDQLHEAAELEKVGVTQLAKRLHISPSAVSRSLGGESDMKISTAVLYARALGRQWEFSLRSDCSADGNNRGRAEMITQMGATATTPTPTLQLTIGNKTPSIPTQPIKIQTS